MRGSVTGHNKNQQYRELLYPPANAGSVTGSAEIGAHQALVYPPARAGSVTGQPRRRRGVQGCIHPRMRGQLQVRQPGTASQPVVSTRKSGVSYRRMWTMLRPPRCIHPLMRGQLQNSLDSKPISPPPAEAGSVTGRTCGLPAPPTVYPPADAGSVTDARRHRFRSVPPPVKAGSVTGGCRGGSSRRCIHPQKRGQLQDLQDSTRMDARCIHPRKRGQLQARHPKSAVSLYPPANAGSVTG